MVKKRLKWMGIGLSAVLVIVVGLFYAYTLDYYHALPESLKIYQAAPEPIKGIHVFGFQTSNTGIIFYPGGKVEAAAYAQLCTELAQKGYDVFLVDMPFNLAVFNIDGADQVRSQNPHIKTWYLAGHSLGGAMASSHELKRPSVYAGLILLAAYPLEHNDEPYLIIKGSNDQVLDSSKLSGFEVQILEGGNHAYFGSYGEQKGDGLASISPQDQLKQTIEYIDAFIKSQP